MTTQGMWQMLSELLDGEKLPDSLNKDIYDLCEGKAVVVCNSIEPVAYMTKEGYVYGKHETRPVEADIPLYTKPFFSQKPVAMMVKFKGFDKPEFTTTCSSAALKHPDYTALYDHPPIAFAELEAGESIPLYEHPMRDLTDEEITQCLNESMETKNMWGQLMLELNPVNFARAILKKASEK